MESSQRPRSGASRAGTEPPDAAEVPSQAHTSAVDIPEVPPALAVPEHPRITPRPQAGLSGLHQSHSLGPSPERSPMGIVHVVSLMAPSLEHTPNLRAWVQPPVAPAPTAMLDGSSLQHSRRSPGSSASKSGSKTTSKGTDCKGMRRAMLDELHRLEAESASHEAAVAGRRAEREADKARRPYSLVTDEEWERIVADGYDEAAENRVLLGEADLVPTPGVAELKAELDSLEGQQQAAERLAREQEINEQVCVKRTAAEHEEAFLRFMTEDTFRWNIVPDREANIHPALVRRKKRRPEENRAMVDVPDRPSGPMSPAREEEQWGDRYAALATLRANVASVRHAAEFDLEEALHDAVADSSDDSDGYDEDLDTEWREETGEVYSVCRAFEATGFAGEAEAEALVALMQRLEAEAQRRSSRAVVVKDAEERPARPDPTHKDAVVTPTEEAMLWDAVRGAYRHAEPVHWKRWLTAMGDLLEGRSFEAAPSVATFAQISHAAVELTAFSHRRQRKLRRWANRSTYLIRRRWAVLREAGVRQPTWRGVNSSCGGLSRDVPIPTFTLVDAAGVHAGQDPYQVTADTSDDEEPSPPRRIESRAASSGTARPAVEGRTTGRREKERERARAMLLEPPHFGTEDPDCKWLSPAAAAFFGKRGNGERFNVPESIAAAATRAMEERTAPDDAHDETPFPEVKPVGAVSSLLAAKRASRTSAADDLMERSNSPDRVLS